MSLLRTCDWCGDPIDDRTPYATITMDVFGGKKRRLFRSGGYVGHYHCSDTKDCYLRVDETLQMAHEFAPSIERIPVATGQRIAAIKRKHVKPAEGGAT